MQYKNVLYGNGKLGFTKNKHYRSKNPIVFLRQQFIQDIPLKLHTDYAKTLTGHTFAYSIQLLVLTLETNTPEFWLPAACQRVWSPGIPRTAPQKVLYSLNITENDWFGGCGVAHYTYTIMLRPAKNKVFLLNRFNYFSVGRTSATTYCEAMSVKYCKIVDLVNSYV